jgi:virginiamycin B lyase
VFGTRIDVHRKRMLSARCNLSRVLALVTATSALTMHVGCALAAEGSVFLPSETITEFFVQSNDSIWSGIAVGPEGDIWFTASNPGRIMRISPNGVITGEFVPPFGAALQPDAPVNPSEPGDIALGPNNEMWFTDASTNSNGESLVGYVTPIGEIREFPIGYPAAEIARGADNNMWYTENLGERIGRITEAGVVTQFKLPAASGEFSRPIAIAQGADGNMWATKYLQGENGQYTIDRVTPSGVITPFPIPPPYRAALSIALGPDGNIWFTQVQETIGRITPAGVISEFPVTGVGQSVNGLVAGPDGNMWFTESTNTLGRITPAGVAKDFIDPIEGHGLPMALTRGEEGDLWYTNATGIGRLRTPVAPANEVLPTLSGEAVEGQVLSVERGSWSHDPSEFRYQWQTCDASGAGCTGIVGQNEATHVLAASDVGHTLRAMVTASDYIGESASVSMASAVVRAAPRLTPPVALTPASEAPPLIGAGMTWNFGFTRRYTIVESLVMHGVPVGSTVEVVCHGGGCGFTHWRSGEVVRRLSCKRRGCRAMHVTVVHGTMDMTELFKGRRLRVGTRIVVGISKAKWIGKSFAFTVLPNKTPRVKIACIGSALGSSEGC